MKILNSRSSRIASELLTVVLLILGNNLILFSRYTHAAPIDNPNNSAEPELTIDVTGERRIELPKSTPVYTIDRQQIERQGAKNVADTLNNLPGFAINNAGYGADIHTGTYYRGASINQFIILLNGRPIGNNINTYHGATDLNSIPVDAIERIELSSGASNILYGSETFGGVVNIITKTYQGTPQTNISAELGSYGRQDYRASYTGGSDRLNYRIGVEKYRIDNNYRVPVGAANRDPVTGNLTNADTDLTSYSGKISATIDDRNRLDFDAIKITSRRGLVYFGFPFQRDRLNHDALNVGLNWRSQLSSDRSSILNTTLSFNQDYFDTFGPSGANSRRGTLDSQDVTGRIDHNWKTSATNTLRWGGEIQNRQLNGTTISTVPNRIAFNETENRNVVNTALFAVNTWKVNERTAIDIGLRQNFNTQFGNYLNPSLGSRWEITPNLALRASVAGAQRNPGLDQLYLYDTVHGWFPNPNLKPETGATWTAGVDLAFSPTSTATITYFGSNLNDRIATQAISPTVTQWTNIGQVSTNGLEIGFKQQITPQWSAFANYTYTDAKIQSGIERGLQLSLVPYSVAQLGVGYANRGWEVNLLANYNAGTRRAFFNNPGQISTNFVSSFFNLDLSARIPVGENVGVNLYVENLADVQYEKVNRIYSPGRTYRVGVAANF
ncbi:TonB-dependent receptor plug domain-containing protein [Chamaesiphon minutus]|uniref:Outer membrane cobalamin receptor protein n=1 Tax=Chamaesiphon minutus (strain ATCC 27169 / PCC 6605) TaxID=1173020 RepID=K9UIQ1_CHAP6|nr:TonB-dependent receptor [Chamaesiphon minutus]AFY94084.1 outer membrane cobalamin receptor protein [Chamaesiphon minutus PCC 6605]